jgi:hypothetical protein
VAHASRIVAVEVALNERQSRPVAVKRAMMAVWPPTDAPSAAILAARCALDPHRWTLTAGAALLNPPSGAVEAPSWAT